jgi:hypothetical protein
MALVEPIRIDNLRELQQALRTAQEGSQKKLRVVFNSAAETVAGGAARRVPRDSGKARASIKPKSEQRVARVIGGGPKAPYYPWLDFGGRIDRGGHPMTRKFIEGGRYLYPSWTANRKGILEGLADAISDLAVESGLEVT